MNPKKYLLITIVGILLIFLAVIITGKVTDYETTHNSTISLNLNSNNTNVTVSSPTNSFAFNQDPSFHLVTTAKSGNQADPPTVEVVGANNETVYKQTAGPTESFGIIIDKAKLTPGRYKIMVTEGDKTVTQDFTWGVLAINTNKSIYATGETAKLALAVLNEKGNMVCDADVVLTITDPTGAKTTLQTRDRTITVSDTCTKKMFTLTPDFAASYKILNAGTYTMDLTSTTKNGVYHIRDTFAAQNSLPFSVERTTVTRVFPPLTYPMTFQLVFNQSFNGTIIEKLPAGFEVNTINQNGQRVINTDGTQEIHWTTSAALGQSLDLSYEFKTPEKSPDWYALGPLTMQENGTAVFTESRLWQLAIDTPTSNSFQRKTWYDGASPTPHFWRAYNDTANSRIRFDYSTDGSSWTEDATARITVNTSDFSIQADATYAYITYTNGYDVEVRSTTSYPGTGFGWSAATIAYDGTSSTDYYQYPTITKDTNNKVWIMVKYYNTGIVDEQVGKHSGVTTDDGYIDGSTFATGDHDIAAGMYATTHIYKSFMTFTNITIAGTITTAYLSPDMYNSTGNPQTLLSAVDAANPSSPTSTATFNGETLTTNNVTWNGLLSDSGYINSPEIKTIIQELVDSYTISNSNIIIRWDDHGSGPSGDNYDDWLDYSNGDTSLTPKLHIEFTNIATYVKQGTSANNVTSLSGVTATSLDHSTNTNRYGVITARTAGAVMATWIDGTTIESKNFNGSSWDASPTTVATGLSGLSANMSAVVDSSGNVHLAYIDGSNHVIYKEYTSSWGGAVTIENTGLDSYPSISLDSTSSDLYIFWVKNSNNYIFYNHGTYSAGSWGWGGATQWKATGTNTDVTGGNSAASLVFAEWYDGSAVQWDQITLGPTPTPTLTPTPTPTPTSTPTPTPVISDFHVGGGVQMSGIKIN